MRRGRKRTNDITPLLPKCGLARKVETNARERKKWTREIERKRGERKKKGKLGMATGL